MPVRRFKQLSIGPTTVAFACLGLAACGGSQTSADKPTIHKFGGPCKASSTTRGFRLVASRPAAATLEVRGVLDSLQPAVGLCPGDRLQTGDRLHFEITSREAVHLQVIMVSADGTVSSQARTKLAAGASMRLPKQDHFQLQGKHGTENVVVIASRTPLPEANAELDNAIAAVLAGKRPSGLTPAKQPAADSPLKTRGNISIVGAQQLVVASPDDTGVIVMPLWLEHQTNRSRGIIMHD